MEKEILEESNSKNTNQEDNQKVEEDLDLIEIYTKHNEAP